MNFVIDLTHHRVSLAQQQSIGAQNLNSSWGLRIFSLSHVHGKTKNIFLCLFTELKTYYLSYSIHKHDAINIADPSSVQDRCQMNIVVDLPHCRVSGAQWQSIRAQNLNFSWGLRIFSLSCARDKTKNIFLCLFTELKTYYLSYSIHKHDAINIADPSGVQDRCQINFVIDLLHCRVSVAQWQSIRAQNLNFSWGLRIFLCLSHARDKTKNIFIS